MTKRLVPYGSAEQAHNIAKVGKKKTPWSLVERMPSPDLAAKVGGPSPAPAGQLMRRVVRKNTGTDPQG